MLKGLIYLAGGVVLNVTNSIRYSDEMVVGALILLTMGLAEVISGCSLLTGSEESK